MTYINSFPLFDKITRIIPLIKMINLVVVEQTLNHKLELIESSASSPLSTKQTKTKYTFVVFLNLHTRAGFLSSASTGLFYFWKLDPGSGRRR